MDFQELLMKRRAIRDYLPDPVPQTVIHEILFETRFAPTARNGQPCKFVLIQDRTSIERLSQESKEALLTEICKNPSSPLSLYREHLEDEQFNVFYNAPVLIIICVPRALPSGDYDCALTAAYLMFSAANRGLGTCWVGLGSHIHKPETLAELAIPPDHRIGAPIILGYPRDIPAPIDRHDPHILRIL